jgi:hypothetical protein
MRVLALAVAALLSACSTTGTQNFDNVVTTLHNNGCHVTVNMAVQAGAVNPGSGFQAQGTVDCSPATSPGSSTGGHVGASLGSETPAPPPNFLPH